MEEGIGSVLNGCRWRGLKPETFLPACLSDHWVRDANQNPPKHICFCFVAASEHGLPITPADHQESGAGLHPTTQETGRRFPVATTAPPVDVLNHHPLYRDPGRHRQTGYFEDSGGSNTQYSSKPTFSPSRDSSAQRASGKSTESPNIQTTVAVQPSAATSKANTPVLTTTAVLKIPQRTTFAPSAAGGNKDLRPDEEETTTSTITTTTVITTMQSPGKSAVLAPVCFHLLLQPRNHESGRVKHRIKVFQRWVLYF